MLIRPLIEKDRAQVLDMMRIFYTSDAVWSNGSDEIFNRDIDACVQQSPYLEGFLLEEENQCAGYAMIARSFSTEFGRPCIWIEDLYIQPAYRSRGFGPLFFDFIENRYPDAIFRLEAEDENEHAVHVYRKRGYQVLPYLEMFHTHD